MDRKPPVKTTDHASMIRDLVNRRGSMDEEYYDWEPHFMELRDNILPTRGRFYVGEKRSSSTLNKRIIDATARRSHRTLKAGLMAGMTSPSRAWFKLGLYDEVANEDPEAAQWLHTVQKRMYAVHRGSNIYRTLESCYGDIGLYGTFCGLLRGDFEDVIKSHAFPMGSYRIGDDEDGVASVMHRDFQRSVRQLVNQFGIENVSTTTQNMYHHNQMEKKIDCRHAIEMRIDRDPMSPLKQNKPFANYYWELAETQKFLEISGFDRNPILAPRWEKVDGETYSVSSPGMEALGDAVQLQQQHRDKAMAVQLSYKPPMQAPAGFNQPFRHVPGSVTTLSVTDLQKGGMRPTHEVRPDVQSLMMDIQETQERIRSSFFEDLFLMTAMSDRRQVTATEIAERHEEKLLVLGPVLESLNHGLLQPIIEGTFHYMQEAGIVPEPPESISETPIKVEYISLLAQAQRAVGVASIERTVGFAGSLATIKPEVLDWLDEKEAFKEFIDQVGPPPSMMPGDDDVKQIREAREQAQQQQMLMENAQPMANAAKLISETSERGEEGLARGGVLQ